ncbi:AAA family ATPase [Streptomyces sp. NPDC047108]|uniref:ATP-binding protein n=1 Tax=Streptomyces sp. NPDC047108 TaxID=3155025 RepID=UPI0033E5D928
MGDFPVGLLERVEAAHLERLVLEASRGVGRALLVEGEPGIGKSALLDLTGMYAERLGLRVLSGAAEEIEQRLPFAAISTCLGSRTATGDAHEAGVGALIRGEGWAGAPLGVEAADAGFAESFLAQVDELCAAGPLALVLDDLHWADQASLRVLAELGESLGQLPLLLVGAYRTAPPRGQELDRLRRALLAQGATVLPLEPLDDDTVRELVTQMLGASPGAGLLRLMKDAGGNPLYITELVDTLTAGDQIRISHGTAETTLAPDSPSPGAAVLHRLDFMSPDALSVLRVASVLGSAITVEDLAAVAERPVPDVLGALLDACDAGVLSERGGRFWFRHTVVRQALYDDLPMPLRAALHLEAGLALAGTSAAPELIAEHLDLGTPSGSPRVVDWLAGHGEHLMVAVPKLTVELLRRALEYADAAEPRRYRLRILLAAALLRSGRAAEAEDEARQVLAHHHDRATEGAIWWILARAPYLAGHPDLAWAEIEHALSSVSLSRVETVRLQAFGSVVLLTLGQLDRAESTARQAERDARELGDVNALSDAFQTLAVLHHLQRRTPEALDLADRALRIAQESDAPVDKRIPLHMIRGHCLLALGRTQEADDAMRAGQQVAKQLWDHVPLCDLSRALVMFADGRWDDALAEIRAGLEPSGQSLPRALHSLAAVIAVHRNDLATARHHLSEAGAVQDGSPDGRFYEFLVAWAGCLVDEAEGAPDRALERCLDSSRRGLATVMRSVLAFFAPGAVSLALSSGNTEAARGVTAAIESQAADGGADDGTGGGADGGGDDGTDDLSGIAAHCRGMLDNDPDTLLEAAGYYDRFPWVLFRARYYEDAAATLAQAKRLSEARVMLYRAMDVYADLNATWDATRAASRLRALGVRRGHRGLRGRPSTGWDSLTDTELAVASLVAQGLSNPDVGARLRISRRTVQTHVSNILSKLGLASRVELATVVTAHGLATSARGRRPPGPAEEGSTYTVSGRGLPHR